MLAKHDSRDQLDRFT